MSVWKKPSGELDAEVAGRQAAQRDFETLTASGLEVTETLAQAMMERSLRDYLTQEVAREYPELSAAEIQDAVTQILALP